jgi:hypothetical protein
MAISYEEQDRAPLEIYVAYDHMPAGQYAKLLNTLDALYDALAGDAIEGEERHYYYYYYYSYSHRFHDGNRPWEHKPWLPLCIDTVETGSSITVRFAAPGEAAKLTWVGGDLDFILSRSTAPLCVMAALLTGGRGPMRNTSRPRKLKLRLKISGLKLQLHTAKHR